MNKCDSPDGREGKYFLKLAKTLQYILNLSKQDVICGKWRESPNVFNPGGRHTRRSGQFPAMLGGLRKDTHVISSLHSLHVTDPIGLCCYLSCLLMYIMGKCLGRILENTCDLSLMGVQEDAGKYLCIKFIHHNR